MTEADIQRSAAQLVKSYGAKAAEIAAGKVVAMQQANDDDGMEFWVQVMLAVRDLHNQKPDGGA
jgi:hypothetical protein